MKKKMCLFRLKSALRSSGGLKETSFQIGEGETVTIVVAPWRQKHDHQTATTSMRTQISMVYQEWSLLPTSIGNSMPEKRIA
ncbi:MULTISPECIES: hypothetical protein [Paenibacillus]|uniref:hypothetical protein n=1 Tax=Paenibacillus TaxID=44249 RepID=UPI0004B3104C|nr:MULTISPECIES: hypothetical protein [Paenibacillus]AZH29532.1 hypothetical protein EGM68_12535 [Paenibacillus sp. M-152]MBU9709738.1 hypothetical protein [Paenibacillus sp. AK121]